MLAWTWSHEDGQLRGTAACNSYFADAPSTGPSITIGGVGATEMGCDEPRMAAESAYLAALPEVTEVVRDGETLTLWGDEAELVFTLEPPEPDAPLVGTDLAPRHAGGRRRRQHRAGRPGHARARRRPHLPRLDPGRPVAGRVVVPRPWDGRLHGREARTTSSALPVLAGQDGHVVDVLSSTDVQVEVAELRLTLTDGGHGLGYSAPGR